jgi:hypothetical protein
VNRGAAALVVALAVGLFAAPPTGEAQGAEKVRRIGFLGPSPSSGGLAHAFEQGLRELGYVEGKSMVRADQVIQ